jgi:hypothetical protein
MWGSSTVRVAPAPRLVHTMDDVCTWASHETIIWNTLVCARRAQRQQASRLRLIGHTSAHAAHTPEARWKEYVAARRGAALYLYG